MSEFDAMGVSVLRIFALKNSGHSADEEWTCCFSRNSSGHSNSASVIDVLKAPCFNLSNSKFPLR